MSDVHLFSMEQLHRAFQDILQLQNEIQRKKDVLQQKLHDLKDVYQNLTKTNTKRIFLFCLDSFYFQYKVLVIEMDNIQRFCSLINNRMYADYFKLYNIMLTQIPEVAEAEIKKYPVYKDLEPFHEYRMTDIIQLHRDILRLLHTLYLQFCDRENHISNYSEQINVGRSITSFLQTHEYENTLQREQILLYVNYLNFFHGSQSGYMTKLFQRIDRFQREIEEEILTNYRTLRPSSDDAAMSPMELVVPVEWTEIEKILCANELVIEEGTSAPVTSSRAAVTVDNTVEDASEVTDDIPNHPPAEPV